MARLAGESARRQEHDADEGFELHPGAGSDITSIWEFIAEDSVDDIFASAGESLRASLRLDGRGRPSLHKLRACLWPPTCLYDQNILWYELFLP
jgi:hypothetical protein